MTNARNLANRSTDFVSVRDFGARGDGVTDDSAAFSAAIATGKMVFVPAGTYKVSFDLANNQTIYGEGSLNKTTLIPPAGATHVIRVDSTTSARQKCQIRDLEIKNPNAVANCVGLLFKATNVNTISDWHIVSNVYIIGFDRGIEVLGRQIWASYYNVEVLQCTRCLNVSSDPSTPAFNQNTFIQCRFAQSAQEGVKIVGQSTTLGFYTCDFELCNTSDSPGVAAVYIEDSEQASFIGCYWEDNGGDVPVDTGTLSNNSIGIKFAGSYCHNPKIEQAYFVGSGVLVWVAAPIRGGVLANSRLDSLTNGYALYVSSALSSVLSPPFTYDSSNFTSSKLQIVQDVNGNYSGRVSQSSSCYWMTSQVTIDLTQTSKLMVSPDGATFTGISAINNRIPGMELWVFNESAANTFTIDAGLIYRGSGSIAPRTGRRYIVGGYPANGKLIEM